MAVRGGSGHVPGVAAVAHLFPEGAADRAALDDAVRAAVGYRVRDEDGDAGVVVGVPEAGIPRRPLVLVVREDDTMRFVSLRRVAAVLPTPRLLVLAAAEVWR
jgi:hypothetical protein